MSDIVLRRANVVKRVNSEDKAQALEAKGFLRDGKETQTAVPAADAAELKEQLIQAGKVIETADQRRGELEAELADIKKQLAGAKEELSAALKENASLKTELTGMKEQLDAAVKKNKAAEKK